jgi:lipoate-protein ligase A
MAVDEALLAGVGARTSPQTVRVYAWVRPTVSVGYSQEASTEVDRAACERAGVDVVKRPTGGRAVLHAGELTYSVSGISGEPPLGRTIMESYRAIAAALVAGLEVLGVDADLVQLSTEPTGASGGPSPPCFVSAGRFEIAVEGRKLVGSAQRRIENAVLQHGSLLLDASHVELADLLRTADNRLRRRVRQSLSEKTTNLSSILGRRVSFDDAADALRAGFEAAWAVKFRDGALSDEELAASRRLAIDRQTEGQQGRKSS